jgi:hypothetical protein
MTIKATGSLSMQEINDEFSLGNNLNAYRGVSWWLNDGSSGSFSSSASFSEFYNKRKNAPFRTVQFGRNDFNAGYVSSAVMTINLKTYIPEAVIGDFFEVDSLWWRGSWASLYLPRQRWFIKYGTAYNPAWVLGEGGSKRHLIQCRYAGGDDFQIAHAYSGKSTSFPQNEISIDRITWKEASIGNPFNTLLVQLAA